MVQDVDFKRAKNEPTRTNLRKNEYMVQEIDSKKENPRSAAESFSTRVSAKAVFQETGLNSLEQAYAALLAQRKQAGEVRWYAFEPVSLRLAKHTFYSPDFLVVLANGEIEAHEVKGFWRDDARAKIKVAANLFPFRFCAVQKGTKKQGGGWIVEWF